MNLHSFVKIKIFYLLITTRWIRLCESCISQLTLMPIKISGIQLSVWDRCYTYKLTSSYDLEITFFFSEPSQHRVFWMPTFIGSLQNRSKVVWFSGKSVYFFSVRLTWTLILTPPFTSLVIFDIMSSLSGP